MAQHRFLDVPAHALLTDVPGSCQTAPLTDSLDTVSTGRLLRAAISRAIKDSTESLDRPVVPRKRRGCANRRVTRARNAGHAIDSVCEKNQSAVSTHRLTGPEPEGRRRNLAASASTI
jgi:hypothetical protein